MNVGWQDAITLALVAAAAIYVLRRLWRAGRGKRFGCGPCPSCHGPSDQGKLISIETPKRQESRTAD